MNPAASQSKSFSCDCQKYCKGRPKIVSRSTYNRHKKYRELDITLANDQPFIATASTESNHQPQQFQSVEFLNAQGSYINFENDENEHRRKRKRVESENGEALKLDDSDLARRHFTTDASPMSNSLSGNMSPLSNALGLYLYTPDTAIFANYSDRTNHPTIPFESTHFSTATPPSIHNNNNNPSTPITARANSTYSTGPSIQQPALSHFSSLPSMFASNGGGSAYEHHKESLLHPLERVDMVGRKIGEQIPVVSPLHGRSRNSYTYQEGDVGMDQALCFPEDNQE